MSTPAIKNLFRLKSVPVFNKKTEGNEPVNEETRKRTYHEAGFRDSSRNHGGFRALSICLNAIYAKFQNEEREYVEKQRQIKEPYYNEQRSKESEIKGLYVSQENKEKQITNLEEKIEDQHLKIEKLKFEINDLPQNPMLYHVDAEKGASTKFWIGIFLLVPISLYLFTFYISTSYSAFFKEFDINNGIMQNVLDPGAFNKAWADGLLEGSFVTLIPFVFLGLGYLIHMFGENKKIGNYLKIVLLFVITFVFDAILAYQIEEKLYELNKTFDSPPFNLKIAFSEVQFWGIIFAGFVVYIIWGLVFDFIMKEHKERDKIKTEQTKRLNDIKIHEEKVNGLEKQKDILNIELSAIKELIAKAKARIEELQKIIDGVIIPTKEYALYSSEYMQGWITYINEKIAVSHSEKKLIVDECIDVFHSHHKEVGVNNESLNTIYTSVL